MRAVWRVAFFVLAVIAASAFSTAIVYGLLSATPLVSRARELGVPTSEWLQVVTMVVATYASLRIVDGARFDVWSRVGLGVGALRIRSLGIGLIAGTAAILGPSALLLAVHGFSFEPQATTVSWWSATGSALLILVPAAIAEELTVRGYLLTALIDGLGRVPAVIVTSILFALLHLLNPDPSVLSTLVVGLAGVFLATVRLTTNSLWAAVVAHLAWNLVQAVALHAPVSGLPLPTPGYRLVDRGPAWLTGGSWGPEGGLAAALGMTVATFLLVRSTRKPVEIQA